MDPCGGGGFAQDPGAVHPRPHLDIEVGVGAHPPQDPWAGGGGAPWGALAPIPESWMEVGAWRLTGAQTRAFARWLGCGGRVPEMKHAWIRKAIQQHLSDRSLRGIMRSCDRSKRLLLGSRWQKLVLQQNVQLQNDISNKVKRSRTRLVRCVGKQWAQPDVIGLRR